MSSIQVFTIFLLDHTYNERACHLSQILLFLFMPIVKRIACFLLNILVFIGALYLLDELASLHISKLIELPIASAVEIIVFFLILKIFKVSTIKMRIAVVIEFVILVFLLTFIYSCFILLWI
jgi:hypothetical protein